MTALRLATALSILLAPTALAVTIHVDDDAPSDPGPGDPAVSDPNENGSVDHPYDAIQEAIDAAIDDDEIVVADGTYTGPGNRDLRLHGKRITVRSAGGAPDTCVLDAEFEGRVLEVIDEEGRDTLIEGFTMRRGRGYETGGAVFCYMSSPTFRDCVFTDSETVPWDKLRRDWAWGGGVGIQHQSPRFVGCRFVGNRVMGRNIADGGGVSYLGGDAVVFEDCLFTNNVCIALDMHFAGLGGAISHDSPTPLILRDCRIEDNDALAGGGISCRAVHATRTQIVGNHASFAGGISVSGGGTDATFVNCAIERNTVHGDLPHGTGGGAFIVNANGAFVNCVFRANLARCGGAVFTADSTTTMTNCTLITNAAVVGPSLAAGLDPNESPFLEPAVVDIRNCILRDAPNGIANLNNSPITVTFSNVWGGWPDAGNIDAPPLFYRDPNDGGDGWGDDPNTPADEGANDDLGNIRPMFGTPGIDAGNNTLVPTDLTDLDDNGDANEPLPLDFAGATRFVDDPFTDDPGVGSPPVVDMGAYEYSEWPLSCAGDYNCDGYIDVEDVDYLLAALYSPEAWSALYRQRNGGVDPTCQFKYNCDPDFRNDGTTYFDIAPFLSRLGLSCFEE